MSNIRTYLIDGEKPIEVMTDEERDEYFLKKYGQTYAEFKEDAIKNKEKYRKELEEAIKRDAK